MGMELIEYIQEIASTFLTTMSTIFEFFGSISFFVFLFAIFYLIYNKNFAFKYFCCYLAGFIVGSLFLKNVINKPRPYEVNSQLLKGNLYSGSFPSSKSVLVSNSAGFVYLSTTHEKKYQKILLIIFLISICLLTGFSQLYFANNYLLDVLAGLFLGIIIFVLSLKLFKKINFNKKLFLIIFAPLLLILLLFFYKEIFTNNFANSEIFEFVGISLSTAWLSCIPLPGQQHKWGVRTRP